VVMILSLNTH